MTCPLVLVLAAASLIAAAETESINPIGRPPGFDQGTTIGYALWYEDGYWEVRVTSPNRKNARVQVYTGTITIVGGQLAEGRFEGLEKKKSAKDSDWIRVNSTRTAFEFHLIAKGRTDSFRFKVSRGANQVRFNLLTTGDDDPRRIRIGPKAESPSKVPFELPAHPEPPAE